MDSIIRVKIKRCSVFEFECFLKEKGFKYGKYPNTKKSTYVVYCDEKDLKEVSDAILYTQAIHID